MRRGLRVTHKVVWREPATADLEAIYDWIADAADPETALRFVTRIEAACEKLADFPRRGRLRADILPGLRSIPFARTVTVFYIVDAGEVRIVHIFHARRDAEAAFAQD
jgi:toxin ParE1/3/4